LNYGDIIRDTFWITLRNRYLWFFGFFAGGGAGSFNYTSPPSDSGGDFEARDLRDLDTALALALQEGRRWALDNLTLIAVVAAIALLIFLLYFALSLISTGALAESVAAIDRGENRRFSSAWRVGISNFWRLLGLAVIFFLIWAGLLLILGLPMALLFSSGAADSIVSRALAVFTAVSVAILLVAVVFIPLGIVGQFALRGLVVRGERVFASIRGGYRTFRQNLGRSLLLWLIQVVIAIGAGIALVIAALIAGFVLFVPVIILAVAGSSTGALVAGVVAGLILVACFIVVTAFLGTFNHSYWTLAYLRLTAEGAGRV
jgi:membrane-anchored glycerophosphoryl diester phosphodiesterase (GDPDase)